MPEAVAMRSILSRAGFVPGLLVAAAVVAQLIVVWACAGPDSLGPEPPATVELTPMVPAAATTNVWNTKAAMPSGRYGLAVGAVNGLLYAIGGTGASTNLTTVQA